MLVIIFLHFFYDLCFSIQYSLVLQIRSYMNRVIGHVFFHGSFPSQLFLWDLATLPVAILYFNYCRVFHYMNTPLLLESIPTDGLLGCLSFSAWYPKPVGKFMCKICWHMHLFPLCRYAEGNCWVRGQFPKAVVPFYTLTQDFLLKDQQCWKRELCTTFSLIFHLPLFLSNRVN